MNRCVSHTLKQNDTGRAQRLVTVNIQHYKKAQWPLTPKHTQVHKAIFYLFVYVQRVPDDGQKAAQDH